MGDKKNAIKKLQQAIKSTKYPLLFEVKEIDIGSPREYLKLYHYLFMDFSPLIANEILTKHNMELNSKSDKAFIDGVYKICRDMFNYVPKLTRDHFFSSGYALVKATMTIEIITLIQGKLKSLQPTQSVTCVASSSGHSFSNKSSSSLSGIALANNIKKSNSSTSIDSTIQLKQSIQNHRSISKTNLKSNIPTFTNEEQGQSLPVSLSSEIKVITEAFEKVNSKFDSLQNRLIPIETMVNSKVSQSPAANLTEPTGNQIQISRSEFENLLSKISNLEDHVKNLTSQNENFQSRITVLETQNLTNKITSTQKPRRESFDRTVDEPFFMSRESMNGTVDEFYSFIDNSVRISSGNEGALPTFSPDKGVYVNINKPGILCQGEAVDFDQTETNNFSIDSNDMTPTLGSNVKAAKFTNGKAENITAMDRAKDLVTRASMLSKDLNSNIKSM